MQLCSCSSGDDQTMCREVRSAMSDYMSGITDDYTMNELTLIKNKHKEENIRKILTKCNFAIIDD